MPKNKSENIIRAKEIFRAHSGILRTSEAIEAGIHPRTLYTMRDAGVVDRISRGLYRLSDLPPLGSPDLLTVARRIPKGVICLISALSFHDLTTQIPHTVWVAVKRGTEPPRIAHPPIQTIWFIQSVFDAGVEIHSVDGQNLRVYCAEKTLADCFKYRNKIGLEVALEALRFYRQRKKIRVDELVHYSRVCRVEKVMRPYLEATL